MICSAQATHVVIAARWAFFLLITVWWLRWPRKMCKLLMNKPILHHLCSVNKRVIVSKDKLSIRKKYIDGHEYEIVDKLCYLGDMLSQEGGCEHAILKRIQTGWLKFRELSGLLIGKGMSLRAKGIIYTTCIRPAMLYGSETWPTKIEDIKKIQRSEMRMLRWMTGVSLSESKSNECVRSMLAIDDIGEVMRRNRLRWFGHVERRDELCWIKRIETLQVDGDGVKGRPKKRWREVLRENMREKDFVGKMLGTGQDGGECCGKAIGEVDPSTPGKTTSLK